MTSALLPKMHSMKCSEDKGGFLKSEFCVMLFCNFHEVCPALMLHVHHAQNKPAQRELTDIEPT